MALKPIADAVGLERVIVSSYQSVSGTGQAAVTELREQTAGLLAGDEPEPAVYPHPIAFNVLPHIDVFDDDGYTGEERKVGRRDAQDAAACPDLAVSATCVRVPVLYGALAGGPHRDDRRDHRRRGPQPADGRPRRRAGRRARAQRYPLPREADRPRRGASWGASARTPRTRAAWRCGW